MSRKILISLSLVLIIIIIGVFKFTNGNPKEFVFRFRNAASAIDGHHTHIESVSSISWMRVNDPELLVKVLKTNFGFTSKQQPDYFLLIVEGTFTVTGGYAADNQPNIPQLHKGVGFGMTPIDQGGSISAMSWGAERVDYNKLKELGEVHKLSFPFGKAAWFLLYDIYGISTKKLIFTSIFSLLLLKIVRTNRLRSNSESPTT